MHPKTRQALLNLARLVISAALFWWIVAQAGLADLLEAARRADPGPYALALLIAVVGIPIRAYRWQVLLDAVGARLPFWRTNHLYFVGAFFNAFLPTGFGGDVVRVLEIGEGASSPQAAGTVLVDRLTGFIALFMLALAALGPTLAFTSEHHRYTGRVQSIIPGKSVLVVEVLSENQTVKTVEVDAKNAKIGPHWGEETELLKAPGRCLRVFPWGDRNLVFLATLASWRFKPFPLRFEACRRRRRCPSRGFPGSWR